MLTIEPPSSAVHQSIQQSIKSFREHQKLVAESIGLMLKNQREIEKTLNDFLDKRGG